jgi:hypothetical protein
MYFSVIETLTLRQPDHEIIATVGENLYDFSDNIKHKDTAIITQCSHRFSFPWIIHINYTPYNTICIGGTLCPHPFMRLKAIRVQRGNDIQKRVNMLLF